MTWRGIPVTTVARTLVDLAASLSTDDLARACHEAGVRHRTTPAWSRLCSRGVPTARALRSSAQILRGDVHVTLSRLESRFLERLREAGLVLPETNRPAGGRRVDCRWPEQRLTVELDSYRYHHSRHAWEQDRRREREARARGDEFRRYTYGDVFEQPAAHAGRAAGAAWLACDARLDGSLDAVGEEVCRDFMWMFEVELSNGKRLQAYKHADTRRYIHSPLPGLAGVTAEQISASWTAVGRLARG